MSDLRNGWDNIDEFAGIPGIGIKSVEKFIQGRSISIAGKVRNIFIRDFIIKSVAALFIILNLFLYGDYENIQIINAVLGVFLIVFTLLGYRFYREFTGCADPGKSSRETLTSLLTFLTRKFPYEAVIAASTYICGFLPGILVYYMLEYGYLKPFTPMSYFVFSFLGILGTVFGYILDMRQIKHHIRHIRVCLSDLNDNALAAASENIEQKRKSDNTLIILVQVVILLAFLVIIAMLKSIVT